MELNPRLFAALKRAFGHVKISNPGVPMAAVYLQGPDGKARLSVSSAGEYYVIACPYCHDTKGRLFINHRWGVRDKKNGTRNLWLAKCFLNDCMASWDNRSDLAERLEDYGLAAGFGAINLASLTEAPLALTPCRLPEFFQLLSDLSGSHFARQYVVDRKFDPEELSNLWGVGYAAPSYSWQVSRLVIPLRACPESSSPAVLGDSNAWIMVGHQGRLIGDASDKQPKYLTSPGTPKSRLLFGLDRVPAGDSPVVVVEGPTDVWRAGPGAVAVLGKDVSDTQCKLLRSVVPGRAIVVMFDPEARAEALTAAEKIRVVLARDLSAKAGPGRVVVARLPDTRDPGDCTRDEIWDAARRALAAGKSPRKAASPALVPRPRRPRE